MLMTNKTLTIKITDKVKDPNQITENPTIIRDRTMTIEMIIKVANMTGEINATMVREEIEGREVIVEVIETTEAIINMVTIMKDKKDPRDRRGRLTQTQTLESTT